MSTMNFEHRQAAHCESGVTSSLLQNKGVIQLTEPLAFGIGAGLLFGYIPFIKINKGPAITFRTMPGMIFKRTCAALGIPVIQKKFRSPAEAVRVLDESLAAGNPVGCQVGVYYLPYFPREYRFHFNAHNLIVYDKSSDQNEYTISDPIMEQPTLLSGDQLERVRFAKGPLAPSGQLYYPAQVPEITAEKLAKAIRKGIKTNAFRMLYTPWCIGANGIRFLGRSIEKWPLKLGMENTKLYLAQLVRMQEEIGTGGGGFRYIYAAFLQESYSYLPDERLLELSKEFTRAGDLWRDSAVQAAGIYKGRLGSPADFKDMNELLQQISAIEKSAFTRLQKLV